MTVAYASNTLTLSGGTSAAYLTPNNIISDATAFSTTNTYAVGALVKQDAGGGLGLALYRCSTAITVAGSFNVANWTVVAWLQGSRSLYMNSILSINGFFNDTDWTITYAPNTRPIASSSAVWLSGRVVTDSTGRSVTTGGGKHVYLNTGLTWAFTANPQMASGCQLEWYGVYIKAFGDGFVKWFDSSSTVHTLVNVTFDLIDTTYKWLMLGFGAQPSSSSSFTIISATLGQLGTLPAITWTEPTAASIPWSLQDNTGAKVLTINDFAPIFKDASQKLACARHSTNTDNEYVTKNPKYDFIARDDLLPGDAGEKSIRTITHDLTISCINAATGATVNPQVSIVSGSVEKANAAASSGKYSGNIATYKKTLTAPSTTTTVDHTSLTATLREQSYIAGTLNLSYTDMQAGAVSKSIALFADSAWTADGSTVTGVAFSVASGAVTATVTSNASGQDIYNAWKWWSSQSAQMAVSQGLITITNGILNITGSITTSATVAGGGNVTVGIKVTGTASTTGSGTYSLKVADSTGVEVEITSLNPQAFTLDANYPATVLYRNVGATTWTRVSITTGSSVKFKRPASTDTEVSVRVPGYAWKTFTLNSGASGITQSAELSAIRALDGTALFGVAGVQAQMDAIAYNSTDQRIYITNTGTTELTIELQSAYLKFAQIIHNPNLIGLWGNQIELNAARTGFEIPSGNSTTVYVSSTSTANIYLSFLVKFQASGLDARDRFIGNASGKVIMFATQVNQLSVAVPSASDNAQAVRANLATELGRIDAKVSDAVLTTAQKQALTDLDSMTSGTGATAQFTALALEKAPASSGGTGGSGLTAAQSTQLATLHNTLVAHKYDLSSPVIEGATTLPIASTFASGYFDGHYIVINDGSGSPIQRSITSHTVIGPVGTLTLNAPIPAITAGKTVNILIRTTTQDGAALDDIERAGGKVDKAMKAAQAAEDQTL